MFKKIFYCVVVASFICKMSISFAVNSIDSTDSATSTKRTSLFANKKVAIWETAIAPGKNKILKMHRHDKDRVIVALDDGLLKVTNDKGEIHFLKLEKNKAYFLEKDTPNELHNDQNMTASVVRVLVIELK